MKPIPLRLSIDIETLSSKSDAAIIAIGACTFDHESIHDRLEILINPAWTLGHRSLETWDWWQQQDDAIRINMFGGKLTPWDAAVLFEEWLKALPPVTEIWANPPSFDITIIRNWYLAMGSNAMDKTLPFRNERDYRTVKAIAKSRGWKDSPEKEGRRRHEALDDAIAQAEVIQSWIREEIIS